MGNDFSWTYIQYYNILNKFSNGGQCKNIDNFQNGKEKKNYIWSIYIDQGIIGSILTDLMSTQWFAKM